MYFYTIIFFYSLRVPEKPVIAVNCNNFLEKIRKNAQFFRSSH